MSLSQSSSANPKKRDQNEPVFLPVKPIAVITMGIVLLVVALGLRSPNSEQSEGEVISLSVDRNYPRTLPELSLRIKSIIDDQDGEYSIHYTDLTTGETFGFNDHLDQTAASVMKIPILASVYNLADNGELDLDDSVEIDEKYMQRWGTGIIRYEPAGVSYTLRELAQIMIEHSDNTAAYVFTHKVIGQKKIRSMIDSWGLDSTNIEENVTSNRDMSKLFSMIYNNEIAREELSSELIGWMDDSEFENRLPLLIPDTVPVYHKIGNEVRIIHDVGIIDLDKKPYYFGVMVSETGTMEKTEEVIAELSKLVYDYQVNRK